MSEQFSKILEINKSKNYLITPASFQPHRAWDMLFLVAGILVLVTFIFNDTFVEHWFSSDGYLTDGGRNYLNLLRSGLLVIAGGCIVLWTLRKIIVGDWRAAISRWKESPSRLDASAIIPPTHPVALQRILCIILPLWIAGVTISLIPGYDAWATLLTVENGVFETLTVICYLFAGFISLKLAIPYLKRNSRRGLIRWWLLGLAAGCLFVAIEEINWGELYFHYEGAEFIRQSNYQNEVSLHNIHLPILGSYWANDLLQIIAVCGGVLLPLMIRFSKSFRRLAWAADVPLPPWLSQAYFFAAALIPQDHIIELQRANIPSELREVTIAFGVAIWLWCVMQNRRKAR